MFSMHQVLLCRAHVGPRAVDWGATENMWIGNDISLEVSEKQVYPTYIFVKIVLISRTRTCQRLSWRPMKVVLSQPYWKKIAQRTISLTVIVTLENAKIRLPLSMDPHVKSPV